MDSVDLAIEGKHLGTLPGRVFPGEYMLKLLEKAEFRRDMRDAISMLIDKIAFYLSGHCKLNFVR